MAKEAMRCLMFLIQKRCLSTSAATVATPTSSFTVEYLVNSCGMSRKSALSAFNKLQLNKKNLHKPELVVQFLKAHDFTDTHIAKLIEKKPQILLCMVEGNLRLKFDYLVKNGFVGRLLAEFFLLNPQLPLRSLDGNIKPCVEILMLYLKSNEKVLVTLKRCSWLLTSRKLHKNLRENIVLLLEEGVPAVRVERILMSHPMVLAQMRQRTAYALTTVKNLCLEPKAPMFAHAVRVILQISKSAWKKKIEVFKSVGWSDEDVSSAFKHHPFFMNGSVKKIRIAMDFYMNTMMFNRKDIIANPVLLNLSMEQRVLPRWNLIRMLMSNKLISEDVSRKRMLMISEESFLQRYIYRYVDQLPDLMTIYKGSNKAISR